VDEGVITSQHWRVLLRAIVTDAALCTFRHEGRIADLRCARKLNWKIEVSGRSGLRSSFSDVQMQLTAAWRPILQMLQVALVTG
jgi:hypothetical protein